MTEIRLLLVEDNPGDARLIQEELRDVSDAQFRVHVARSLQQGIATLESSDVDVILLDLGLPDSQGLDTLEGIFEKAAGKPIVVLTGNQDESVGIQAVQEGAQDYLVKGRVGRDALARSIRYAVERRRAMAAQEAARSRKEELDRLQEAERLKGDILGSGDETGSPLARMRLMFYSLRNGSLGDVTEQQRRAVAQLEEGYEQLGRIVQDVVDVASLQTRSLQVHPEEVDARDLVRDAIRAMSESADRAGIKIMDMTRERLPVRAEANRILQVLFHLLSNALRMSRPGQRIRVEAKSSGPEVLVHVHDEGIGLTPEQVERLFTPFCQVHPEIRYVRHGAGLGLFVSKGLIEAHGGRMWCVSPGPGMGATFSFSLPKI